MEAFADAKDKKAQDKGMTLLGESVDAYPSIGLAFVTRRMLIDGKEMDRVGVKPGDTVSVLAVTKEGNIVLQLKDEPAVGKRLLMLPESRIDDGATANSARLHGRMELMVHGCKADTLKNAEEIGAVFASPGYTTERVHTVMALGVGREKGAEGTVEMTPEDAISKILSGEIRDSNTIQAVLRYAVFVAGLERLNLPASMLEMIGKQPKIKEEPITIKPESEETLKSFGSFLSVSKQTVATDGDTKEIGVAKLGGAAVTIPIDSAGRIIFVVQERPIVGKTTLELPAGKRDKLPDGSIESAEHAGLRELEEETGEKGGEALLVTSAYSSARYSNEVLDTVLARSRAGGKLHADEGEVISGKMELFLPDALDRIKKGEIEDGKTVQGVLLYALIDELERRAGKPDTALYT